MCNIRFFSFNFYVDICQHHKINFFVFIGISQYHFFFGIGLVIDFSPVLRR